MFLVDNEVHVMDLAAMEDEIEMENDHENQPPLHDLRPTSRALQHDSTVAARKTVIAWMTKMKHSTVSKAFLYVPSELFLNSSVDRSLQIT